MLRHGYKIKTLSTDKVAWLLGTDSKTVCLWTGAGIIKPYRTNRYGDTLFRRGEVARLLARLGA
ncbi:hypothetical protein ACFLXU_02015 [Chloroflexota bacterium]